jgi:hypothetical protein
MNFDTSALAKAYNEEIRAMAEDYAKRIKAGDFDDRAAFMDDVHETLDSHEFVIYTFKAQCVCLVSDNSGAMVDNFGSEGLTKDGSINWEAMAYCAMEADLYDWLDSDGIDLNDDDTFAGEEDEEEEEPDAFGEEEAPVT